MLIAAISLFVSDITIPSLTRSKCFVGQISFSGLKAMSLYVLSTPSQQHLFPNPMKIWEVCMVSSSPCLRNCYRCQWETLYQRPGYSPCHIGIDRQLWNGTSGLHVIMVYYQLETGFSGHNFGGLLNAMLSSASKLCKGMMVIPSPMSLMFVIPAS